MHETALPEADARRTNWPMALLQIGLHWAALSLAGVILGMVLPRFAKMAIEFDMPLPAPAVLAFNLSLWIEKVGWFVLPALALADAVLVLLLRSGGKQSVAISNAWTALLLLFVGGFLALATVAVLAPIMTLIRELS